MGAQRCQTRTPAFSYNCVQRSPRAAYVNSCEETVFLRHVVRNRRWVSEELLGSTWWHVDGVVRRMRSIEMGGAVDLAVMRLHARTDNWLPVMTCTLLATSTQLMRILAQPVDGRLSRRMAPRFDSSPFQAEYLTIARTECAGQNWYACDWLYLFSDGIK